MVAENIGGSDANAPELLSTPPSIERLDVLGAKLAA
jgi:hypothetical protein